MASARNSTLEPLNWTRPVCGGGYNKTDLRHSKTSRFLEANELMGNHDKHESTEISHVLMGGQLGGKIYVTADHRDGFMEALASDLDNNRYVLCMCEHALPIFRLFFDLDFKIAGREELSVDEVFQCVNIIRETVWSCYPMIFTPRAKASKKKKRARTKAPSTFASERERQAELQQQFITICRRQHDKKGEIISEGFHVYFANIFVTREIAAAIREVVLVALREQMPINPEQPLGSRWRDIVDGGVFQNPALRMPLMHKMVKCPSCDGVRKLSCECKKCHRLGKVDLGRVYVPYLVLKHDGEVSRSIGESFLENLTMLLENTSLRTPKDSPTVGFQPCQGMPAVPSRMYVQEDKRRRAKSAYKHKNRNYKFEFPPTPNFLKTAQHMFRGIYDNRYASVEVIAVRVRDIQSLSSVFVEVGGKGSRWCHNIKCEHNSAAVYFTIHRSTARIKQHCMCRCENFGKSYTSTPCREYAHPGEPVISSVMSMLFPESQADQNQLRKQLYIHNKVDEQGDKKRSKQ